MAVLSETILVLCDRVKREEGTGKAMLDGLFDNVRINGLPSGLNATLYIRFYVDDPKLAQVPIQIALIRPNGAREHLPPMMMPIAAGRSEVQIALNNLPLLQPGLHYFVFSAMGSAEVARTRFLVTLMEVPRAAAPNTPTN